MVILAVSSFGKSAILSFVIVGLSDKSRVVKLGMFCALLSSIVLSKLSDKLIVVKLVRPVIGAILVNWFSLKLIEVRLVNSLIPVTSVMFCEDASNVVTESNWVCVTT